MFTFVSLMEKRKVTGVSNFPQKKKKAPNMVVQGVLYESCRYHSVLVRNLAKLNITMHFKHDSHIISHDIHIHHRVPNM